MRKSKKRLSLLIGIVLVIAGVTYWLTHVFKENILYFYTPHDILSFDKTHNVYKGKRFRLGGLVKKGSVKKNGVHVRFEIIDQHNDSYLVEYQGIPPALFAENKGVIADGFLYKSYFKAEVLLAKHDEKYKVPGIASQ